MANATHIYLQKWVPETLENHKMIKPNSCIGHIIRQFKKYRINRIVSKYLTLLHSGLYGDVLCICCWAVLTQPQSLLFFPSGLTGCRRGIRRQEHLTSTIQRNIPQCMMLHSAKMFKDTKRKKGCFQLWSLSSQVIVKYDEFPHSCEWLDTQLST